MKPFMEWLNERFPAKLPKHVRIADMSEEKREAQRTYMREYKRRYRLLHLEKIRAQQRASWHRIKKSRAKK